MNPKKRFLLLNAIFGFLTVAVTANAQTQSIRPNIVVFLVDDMGLMDTSLPFLTDEHGNTKRYPLNDHYRTPNMERLAEQGVRFNQFYAMSVCSPTRISIMTGQNAARHASTNWINPDKDNAGTQGPPDWNWEGLNKTDITLPRLLGEAGYRTIHVGKAHFGPRDYEGSEPLNLGFDINIGGASFGAPGSYYAEDRYGWGTKRETHAVPHLYAYHGSDTFLTEALTLETKKVLTSTVEAEEPFYLYFAHYAVHGPFHSDPRFAQNYVNSGKSEKAQAFATLIEGMDKSLGDILDYLNELGVAENTLILFLGDNGSDGPLGHQHEVACAAPLRGKKGAHYEGGMRVPFIAAWAKPEPSNSVQHQLPIAAGVVQPQVASVSDLFPTLTALLSLETPKDHVVDGLDLSILLTGEKDTAREETFLMHYPHGPHRSDYFTVYREGDWKVIYHFFPTEVSNGSHYQVFNLKKDPFESTDVASEQPKVLKRLMRGLAQSLESHDALFPVNKAGQPVLPIVP